jgi:hypothetical protein
MKTSIHFRFAAYVLWVTAAFASLVLCWYSERLWFLFFVMMMPSATKLLGKECGAFFQRDREVSDRALFWGFLAFLAAFWVGAIAIAHYLSPGRRPTYLIWGAAVVLWLVFLYPGYRWWREQRCRVDA